MKFSFDELNAMIRSGGAERALDNLEAALKDEELDYGERIRALDACDKCYFALGRAEEGLKAFRSICELARDLHARRGLGAAHMIAALYNYTHALTAAGRLEEAGSIANEACGLALAAYRSGSPKYADALFRMAEPSYRANDFETARSLLTRAAAIWSGEQDFYPARGTCLNNLGRVCEEMGDIEAGMDWHHRAVEYRRKLPEPLDLAYSLGNYGLALAAGGKLEQAIEALRECLSIYEKIGAGGGGDCQSFRGNLLRLELAMGEGA